MNCRYCRTSLAASGDRPACVTCGAPMPKVEPRPVQYGMTAAEFAAALRCLVAQ